MEIYCNCLGDYSWTVKPTFLCNISLSSAFNGLSKALELYKNSKKYENCKNDIFCPPAHMPLEFTQFDFVFVALSIELSHVTKCISSINSYWVSWSSLDAGHLLDTTSMHDRSFTSAFKLSAFLLLTDHCLSKVGLLQHHPLVKSYSWWR